MFGINTLHDTYEKTQFPEIKKQELNIMIDNTTLCSKM